MAPLASIFIIAICSSVIVSWLIFYLSKIIFGRLSAGLLFSGQNYFRQVFAQEEAWPRISGLKVNAFERWLGWAGSRRLFSQPVWLGISLVSIFIFFIFLVGPKGIALFFLGLVFFVGLLFQRAQKRKRAFVNGLPSAIDGLIQALRAGYSFNQAVSFVAKESTGPVGDFLKALERGANYRVPLRRCLAALDEELELAEWKLFSESIMLAERTGGNIIPIISGVANTIRQNAILEQEMRTATASGRMSGWLITGLVPLILLLFLFLNPGYLEVFFNTGFGKFLLILALLLEITGFLIIRKITRISY